MRAGRPWPAGQPREESHAEKPNGFPLSVCTRLFSKQLDSDSDRRAAYVPKLFNDTNSQTDFHTRVARAAPTIPAVKMATAAGSPPTSTVYREEEEEDEANQITAKLFT